MSKEQALEYIDTRIDTINRDERYHYPPANVFANAPLALIQTEFYCEIATLKSVKKILEM